MKKRYAEKEIPDLIQRKIFLDANIIIYLFWPTSSSWEKSYSSIYKNLLKQKNEMVVDLTVLSEFINSVLRLEYKNYLDANPSPKITFKQFRDSPDGHSVTKDIYEIVKSKILTHFSIAGLTLAKSEIDKLLHVDNLDFSDKFISTLCERNNFILLTNDFDFQSANIEILSSNPNLLKS